ncbi:hypothetical protein [Bacillus piscicola]|uniref:hypothetical protein n=1 Tax=Bacillus piscicola TaxID=1632684 RepID=UPI001F098499|nr:hypothetical protein [Bacillus piscicola]
MTNKTIVSLCVFIAFLLGGAVVDNYIDEKREEKFSPQPDPLLSITTENKVNRSLEPREYVIIKSLSG